MKTCNTHRQPQQADETSPRNLRIRTAMQLTFSPFTTINQSTFMHSNQTLSQIVFDEVRVLSRHHLTPTKKWKIDPGREVVEADVMWKAGVVATQVCSSHENTSSSAWAKRSCEAVHREKCLQCHPECSMFQRCKTSSGWKGVRRCCHCEIHHSPGAWCKDPYPFLNSIPRSGHNLILKVPGTDHMSICRGCDMTQSANLYTTKQRQGDPARNQSQHDDKRNQAIKETQHGAVFSTGRSVNIIGRDVPSIGNEHVRVLCRTHGARHRR